MFKGLKVEPEMLERATRRGPIVLIEDDAAVRDVLQCALTQWGFSVLAEETGRTVITTVRTHRASAVITDIYMPDIDGIEVIRTVRRECPATPVIAMSGGGASGGPFQAILSVASHLGAVAVLVKPFSLDELKAVLVGTLVAS